MPYKLYYFPDDVSENDVEIPLNAIAIDVTSLIEGTADTINKKGSPIKPIYLDNNGNVQECSFDKDQIDNERDTAIADLAAAINTNLSAISNMISISYSSSTLTITFNEYTPSPLQSNE
jgi:hypothetical protein